MTVSIVSGEQWPDDLDRLLRSLPEWFGIEQSIVQYVHEQRTLPTAVARVSESVVGVCVIRHHTSAASEIEVLAVERAWHRRGVGRQFVESVEAQLRRDGIELLQVKTRGPSAPSAKYDRTRKFYEGIDFLQLEERLEIWGPENPCLIMVKPLAS